MRTNELYWSGLNVGRPSWARLSRGGSQESLAEQVLKSCTSKRHINSNYSELQANVAQQTNRPSHRLSVNGLACPCSCSGSQTLLAMLLLHARSMCQMCAARSCSQHDNTNLVPRPGNEANLKDASLWR